METRANYVLIGAITLIGILATFGFFIWLASFEVDRQYDRYDILFDDVSGLSRAANVNFNGIAVGQVVSMAMDKDNPSKVRVRIEVDANTPVLKNTTAQLRSQGVTGVSYVALSGGIGDSEPLVDPDGGVPVIVGQRSLVDQLSEDAPDLLSEALKVIRDIQTFTGGENQAYVAGILKNLDAASGQLDSALSDFSSITRTVAIGDIANLQVHRPARSDQPIGADGAGERGRDDDGGAGGLRDVQDDARLRDLGAGQGRQCLRRHRDADPHARSPRSSPNSTPRWRAWAARSTGSRAMCAACWRASGRRARPPTPGWWS